MLLSARCIAFPSALFALNSGLLEQQWTSCGSDLFASRISQDHPHLKEHARETASPRSETPRGNTKQFLLLMVLRIGDVQSLYTYVHARSRTTTLLLYICFMQSASWKMQRSPYTFEAFVHTSNQESCLSVFWYASPLQLCSRTLWNEKRKELGYFTMCCLYCIFYSSSYMPLHLLNSKAKSEHEHRFETRCNDDICKFPSTNFFTYAINELASFAMCWSHIIL